jgi:dCMP deaminase
MKEIFENQNRLIRDVYHIDLSTASKQAEAYRVYTLAAVDELMEALHEVPWKPWSHRVAWDRENLGDELADVFTFLVQLCCIVGVDAEELEERYWQKSHINVGRQESGTYGADTTAEVGTPQAEAIRVARAIARYGECTSAKVGCCILDRDGRMAAAYNHAPDGVERCTHAPEDGCPGRTIHAEVAAVAEAACHRVQLDGATAYVTLPPCKKCAHLLRFVGVKDIVVV